LPAHTVVQLPIRRRIHQGVCTVPGFGGRGLACAMPGGSRRCRNHEGVPTGLGIRTLHRMRPGTTGAPGSQLAPAKARIRLPAWRRAWACHPDVPRPPVRSRGWCSDGAANISLTASGAADARSAKALGLPRSMAETLGFAPNARDHGKQNGARDNRRPQARLQISASSPRTMVSAPISDMLPRLTPCR
jgi:hypothetical protein